ncbi:type IX secretion system membrane protein PorP/SprF [Flavobacterium lindanitolerans]|nr:type IX secretion system membrane protein PorP/SprF [Flavobacterium lindanitolerans]
MSGSMVIDFPRFGWFQTGIDDFYGVGVGLGFHFTKRLSLGYTYERTIKEGLVNLGSTHEITMIFSFQDRILAHKNTYCKRYFVPN